MELNNEIGVTLTPEQTLVNQHLQRLDEVSRKMEAKWGVDRLPKCVPADLVQKWDKQWSKLNDATMAGRGSEVVELAPGCIRAWEALEKAALAAGYQPDIGVALECRMASGSVLRVCSSPIDARKPVPPGYVVYSMEEVARLLEPKQLVNVIEKNAEKFSNKEIVPLPKEFFQSGGDPLPF